MDATRRRPESEPARLTTSCVGEIAEIMGVPVRVYAYAAIFPFAYAHDARAASQALLRYPTAAQQDSIQRDPTWSTISRVVEHLAWIVGVSRHCASLLTSGPLMSFGCRVSLAKMNRRIQPT